MTTGQATETATKSEKAAIVAMAASMLVLCLMAPFNFAVILALLALPASLVAAIALVGSAVVIGRNGGGTGLLASACALVCVGVAMVSIHMRSVFIDVQRARMESWVDGLSGLFPAMLCGVVAAVLFWGGLEGRKWLPEGMRVVWGALVGAVVPASAVSVVVLRGLAAFTT